ncbi:aldo/keto reductase [Streptomyces malaysiensis]|uniref:Aldo/keto reductase n=1 Tax=Streptomyces malaysiensis subsp. samsunensis TaxID=459658 RepID=A0A9X2LRQ4_STRMQ|nr:aldo/keto reductase [Streptomyces samsunensis]MCQ8828721.1 aldo/keto reductase [Streptomyces samsunensis]
MRVNESRPLGRTSVRTTALSFGAAPIGNFLRPFGESTAMDMVSQAWDLGMRHFDTAPLYGHGLSEHRLGHALRRYPRDQYVISTKVGRRLTPAAPGTFDSGLWVEPAPFAAHYDYSYDGIMRSVEESLQRMLTDHVDILLMHDVDRYTHGDAQPEMFRQSVGEGFPALVRLREEGVVSAIGFGVNETDVCLEAIRRTDADCVLLAGRYTLLEQDPLEELLPLCEKRGVGVILGGVYNSGVLATGAVAGAKFNYAPAPPEILERTARIHAICRAHDVALPAAALRFAATHPAVASVCVGSRTPEQQSGSAALFEARIPRRLWDDLRDAGLLRDDAPTP